MIYEPDYNLSNYHPYEAEEIKQGQYEEFLYVMTEALHMTRVKTSEYNNSIAELEEKANDQRRLLRVFEQKEEEQMLKYNYLKDKLEASKIEAAKHLKTYI